MEVLIGVDPHKAAHAVAAVDQRGELLEHASFGAGRSGLRSLMLWAKRFPKRHWAVEGANGMGHLLARHLVALGEKVVDVPAKLPARVRVLSVGHERKNDGLDAFYVALAARQGQRLRSVDEEEHATAMRLLSERREDLVQERTRALNRLHTLLRKLLPGGVSTKLHADEAARALRRVELGGHGVGRKLHEGPHVEHFGRRGHGLRLREGMIFTIEPMINEGTPEIRFLEDGWTVVTADGKLSAQYEHTVAVTADGCEILTPWHLYIDKATEAG